MEQLSDADKKKVEQYFVQQAKKDAIERWLAKQTTNNPVEVYLSRPVRPIFDVSVEGAPYMGGDNAKVVVAEFSDFQCRYCQKGSELLKDVKKKYGDKVRIVFKNFPLSFHNDAETAALAGLCAQDQGQAFFWKLHDKMFQNQDKLDKKSLMGMAKDVGLAMQDFTVCLESRKHKGRIGADIEEGKKIRGEIHTDFFCQWENRCGRQWGRNFPSNRRRIEVNWKQLPPERINGAVAVQWQ